MNAIPPFIRQILGVIVRAVVVWFAGYLAAHAKIDLTDSQIDSIVEYLVPVLAMLAWSFWREFRGRQKLLMAAKSAHVLTEHEVEALVKDPNVRTPSVLTGKGELPR